MHRNSPLFVLLTLLTLAPALPAAAVGPSGYLVGYALQETTSICSLNQNVIQTPLFKPYNRDNMQWWYNVVEEATFSNVSYLGLNVRGDSPCGISSPPGGEPTSFASNLVTAIQQRGAGPVLKVAMFDDTPSYVWHRMACTGNPNATFDLADHSLWQSYIWDTHWKPFFQRVPDQHRMKIQGRPLVIMWSIDPFWGFANPTGNLTPLIQWLRSQSMSTFGFDPFIVVDYTWIQFEPGVGSQVDGVHQWFTVDVGNAWSLYTHTGRSGTFKTGVVNPGFWSPGDNLYRPRNNGQTLRDGLAATSTANLLIMEGLTDIEENAAYYRGSSICSPACGSPYTPPAGQCWSHPNQYLNIVREIVWPNPKYVIFHAEACDAFNTPSSTRTGLFRRDGNLAIYYTDGSTNWSVRLRSNEWLEYLSFQLGGSSNYRLSVRYSSVTGGSGRLLIDGVQKLTFALGPTGSLNTYTEVVFPTPFQILAGNHNIRLETQSGEVRVDQWILNGL